MLDKIQNAHRERLVSSWGIREDSKVLEIGCGQGDTTVALARAVGKTGSVYGIDIASPDYGAPETLGQARDRILNSEIGSRVEMHFNFDYKQFSSFQEGQFDYAVLSHCLWYFSSYDELLTLLTSLRGYCKNLCIAEWSPKITLPQQLPHCKAAVIEAICESFVDKSLSNIRTMFYPTDIERAVKSSGWTIDKIGEIYSEDMQDGIWEVDMVIEEYAQNIEALPMPAKLKNLLLSQIDELRHAADIKPMPVFCLNAG